MEVLKISSKSNPNSVAGAIAGLVKENNYAEMQAIGAGALNQAVKAIEILEDLLHHQVLILCVYQHSQKFKLKAKKEQE